VRIEETEFFDEIKTRYQVLEELLSCHTAIVDGCVTEGYVHSAEIKRFLDERPEVIGIAVADMLSGSPGMDILGFGNNPYDVISFVESGKIEIFASYPNKHRSHNQRNNHSYKKLKECF